MGTHPARPWLSGSAPPRAVVAAARDGVAAGLELAGGSASRRQRSMNAITSARSRAPTAPSGLVPRGRGEERWHSHLAQPWSRIQGLRTVRHEVGARRGEDEQAGEVGDRRCRLRGRGAAHRGPAGQDVFRAAVDELLDGGTHVEVKAVVGRHATRLRCSADHVAPDPVPRREADRLVVQPLRHALVDRNGRRRRSTPGLSSRAGCTARRAGRRTSFRSACA